MRPNNALHLQTTPVIFLASARMPPYAGFQVSLDVRQQLVGHIASPRIC